MHSNVEGGHATPGDRRLTVAEVDRLIHVHFPQAHTGGQIIFIEQIGDHCAELRMKAVERIIRPGGTISGPAMFTLADIGLYVILLAELGDRAIQAVTTNLNINFLARPALVDVLCSARLLRMGKRLAVGEIELRSEGSPDLIAHATATYAIPPIPRK